MGLTIIQKSDITRLKENPKIAIVLAGGVVSGGAYKVGALKAFNDFLVNRKITDFDTYIGLSAGSFIAAPLAGGITPEEMFKSLSGTSSRFSQLRPFDFYRLNLSEIMGNPVRFAYDMITFFPDALLGILAATPLLGRTLRHSLKDFLRKPNYFNFEKILKPITKTIFSTRALPSVLDYIPTGLFENSNLEKYIRENMKRNNLTNDFEELYKSRGKELYMVAVDLDTSERVVFGHDRNNELTISEAIMASTALPGFYKPARIKGRDYIDGGVRRTANIDVAIEAGADLVVCYNPFRPFINRLEKVIDPATGEPIYKGDRISDKGVLSVLNQVFRTMLHSRLMIGMTVLERDPNFTGDIILIEPEENDSEFFGMNPLAFWERTKAAQHGYESVKELIENNYMALKRIFASYGVEITLQVADEGFRKIRESDYSEERIMEVLRGDADGETDDEELQMAS